jgi:hypothetical protein
LHDIALNPFHPAHIDAHGESRSEDLADAETDIPAIVGIRLSGAGGITGAKISRRFNFEFPLVRVASIEPGFVAEVVVNAAAVFVRVVGAKGPQQSVIPRLLLIGAG